MNLCRVGYSDVSCFVETTVKCPALECPERYWRSVFLAPKVLHYVMERYMHSTCSFQYSIIFCQSTGHHYQYVCKSNGLHHAHPGSFVFHCMRNPPGPTQAHQKKSVLTAPLLAVPDAPQVLHHGRQLVSERPRAICWSRGASLFRSTRKPGGGARVTGVQRTRNAEGRSAGFQWESEWGLDWTGLGQGGMHWTGTSLGVDWD